MPRAIQTRPVALAALLALAVAAVAVASTGSLSYRGCFADRGKNGCKESAHNSLYGALGVAVSPDDKSVYVTSILGHSVSEFKRSPSGALTDAGCIASAGARGCSPIPNFVLWGAAGIDVSPDGRSVYVASFIGGTISHFNRAPGGSLSYAGCFENRGRDHCKTPRHASLEGASDVAVSPDGKSVYLTSQDASAITTFKRGANGGLTYGGCFADNGGHHCRKPAHDSLTDASNVAVSSEGNSVYVTSQDSVTFFKHDGGGGLSYGGCVADFGAHECKKPPHRLAGPWGVAVSPDGKSVYVVGVNEIARFRRGPGGPLHYLDCIASNGAHGCRKARHNSLRQGAEVAVSPDGRSVFVASRRNNAITRFRRSSNGFLRYGTCIANHGADGCRRPRHDSLDAATGVAVSPDSRSVYVGSFVGDSVTRFGSR